jgi:hypothetical protein
MFYVWFKNDKNLELPFLPFCLSAQLMQKKEQLAEQYEQDMNMQNINGVVIFTTIQKII